MNRNRSDDPLRPRIARDGAVPQLYVEGKPLILTAGELENSASTGRRYMKSVWPELAAANLNCVLAVIPWDLVEPEEGRFDFRIVDDLVEDARAHGMKLVPLWFGTWKNGLTHYAPSWVKRDTSRFPRSRINGGNVEVVTPLSIPARDADARAFGKVMAHIREIDAKEKTVVMVQVENEVGLFGALRDHSDLANAAFNAPVPADLLDYLAARAKTLLPEMVEMWAAGGNRTAGTWSEVFPGSGHAEEAFMAWHYARFVGVVAAAGKAEYDIPLFVNAALDSPVPGTPGYFHGGPVAHIADIWRAGAPAIDFIGPDIYALDYNGFLEKFNRGGNALFVPESRTDEQGVCNALYTLGRGGIGYSPFGIETRSDFVNGPLPGGYQMINRLAPLIAEYQAKGQTTGARVSPDQPQHRVEFGGYTWLVTRLHYWRDHTKPLFQFGGCLMLQTGPEEFIVGGYGIQVRFEVTGDHSRIAAIDSLDELVFEDGQWVADRRLSGDEIMQSYDVPKLLESNQNGTEMKVWKGPRVLKLKLYSYPK